MWSTVGVVDRRDQHKPMICSPCGQYCWNPSQAKPVLFATFDSLVAVTTHSDACISRLGCFHADNDNNDNDNNNNDRRTNQLLYPLRMHAG